MSRPLIRQLAGFYGSTWARTVAGVLRFHVGADSFNVLSGDTTGEVDCDGDEGLIFHYRPTAIDDYASEYSSGMGWITVSRGVKARFAQVSGLINLAEYTFQVRGVDAALLAEADSDEDLSTLLEVQEVHPRRPGLLTRVLQLAAFVGAAQ